MTTQILSQFKPLFTNDYTYYIYYGGRGGGKSEGIAQSLVLLALQSQVKILCIREFQNSINDSAKAMLERWIEKLQLTSFYNITRDTLNTTNGSSFIFKGLQTSNAVNIKSITGINITWIEEGETISKKSWELLVPSVTREPDPKIIVSFNPRHEDDIVYKTFITQPPPTKSYICKINHSDNPYFKNTNLELQRQHDHLILPEAEYKHKWEGEIRVLDACALWDKTLITSLHIQETYNRDIYKKVVVACDPATTSHSNSNEYGIIVAGLRDNGQIDIIADYGGIYTPYDFAVKVSDVYDMFNADVIVVEENQGGEHIKQTILSISPLIQYSKVWSSKDKITRALPISTLCGTGRVKHLHYTTEGNLSKLEQQLQLMTTQGYRGPKGSSPDRVDAYVWAVSHLAGLKHLHSVNTYFTLDNFKRDLSFEFLERDTTSHFTIIGRDVVEIIYKIYSTKDGKKGVVINRANQYNTIDFKDKVGAESYIPDIALCDGLQGYRYTPLDSKNLNNIPLIKDFIQIDDTPSTLPLKNSLFSYSIEKKNIDCFIYSLCNIINLEL